MMTIEEIRKEKEEIQKQCGKLGERMSELDDMLTAIYDGSTNVFDTYSDKFVKLTDNTSKYFRFVHINKIEREKYSSEESWLLQGPGFSFTLQDDGSVYSMSLDKNSLIRTPDIDLERGYYTIEIITKEEFQKHLVELSEMLKNEKDSI